MSLLARHPREVYRVYDELEYISGGVAAEHLPLSAPEDTRRRGGTAAAAAALLVVGGSSLTLLAVNESRAPHETRVADARRSPVPLPASRAVATHAAAARAAAARARTGARPSRRLARARASQRRRVSRGGSSGSIARQRREVGVAIAPTLRPTARAEGSMGAPRAVTDVSAGTSQQRRPEFGFERR